MQGTKPEGLGLTTLDGQGARSRGLGFTTPNVPGTNHNLQGHKPPGMTPRVFEGKWKEDYPIPLKTITI